MAQKFRKKPWLDLSEEDTFNFTAPEETTVKNPRIAFAAALAAVISSPSLACSVMPVYRNILEKKEAAPVTLHGTLLRIEKGSGCNAYNKLLHFRIERAFGVEAANGDTLVVVTPASSSACGLDYPAGREVVLFAGMAQCQTPTGALWSSLGSHNVELPTRSQLDSLSGSSGIRPGHFPAGGRDIRGPARSGHGMTFPVPGDPGTRRDAGGRAR